MPVAEYGMLTSGAQLIALCLGQMAAGSVCWSTILHSLDNHRKLSSQQTKAATQFGVLIVAISLYLHY